MPRFYVASSLSTGLLLNLPEQAARHAQVLRLQPGHMVTLFNGQGGEFEAQISSMGRHEVWAEVGAHHKVEREIRNQVHLALGIPANERMDWLIEKATELGAASIQPLLTERTVLKLVAERAFKKQAHWQAIAQAACEQCGRNQLPKVHLPKPLSAWLVDQTIRSGFVLSLSDNAYSFSALREPSCMPSDAPLATGSIALTVLSGPEGGLSPEEEQLAVKNGLRPLRLGPATLRADTAPLAALMAVQYFSGTYI
ncbi:MAG: 16S rRNA (uracil(1498)-N(3))-methyltransferase [Betaproteobacteria bacterium]|nr:16S rRNA (uracil(1498)-N(3))-methyltransferase [Betaproteobacteria bacterium]NBY71198.1 16S rRNA (uracil(1498)-N(3))-methyltransferase [Betaproteobacteria bacterium]NDD11759.1 16S rRNA (uracil(1498)-N(3))-methyltransferase [Betaproteobacteria bacterium]